MKNTFFQKNKNALCIAGCILGFALITLLYFYPILEGKRIKQHDIEMFKGMSKEITDYRESTGEQTLWTNSLFGGMPAWNILVSNNSNLMSTAHKALNLGFPHPIGAVFISMLGFFLLLLVLGCDIGTSFIGGLAYGFASYLFIIIGAGHNTKAYAMAYMAPVLAGILLTYKGKYLWGTVLTAIALALEVRANHLQITYYLLIIVAILVIAELVSDIKEKKMGHFAKATGLIVVAAIFAVMTYSTTLYANYVFGKETTRGKPVLTKDQAIQTKGLERDYITGWSYGIGETWSLMIPNVKGGTTDTQIGYDNSAIDKVHPDLRRYFAEWRVYWGDQPLISGPVYVGAIVVFLFVLGALCVKGKLKWALLIATLLSILLSWGKNFMGFTNFFIDYIPGYNKFRSVSMTLVIAEVCIPLLGFLGLAEIAKHPENNKRNSKKVLIALGITAGCCLLFYIAPKVFFSFLSQGETKQFAELTTGENGPYFQTFKAQLIDARVAIFREDTLRSLLFILFAGIPVFFYAKGKLKALPTMIVLGALVMIDMLPIDRRYLNNDNFISKQLAEKPFSPTVADKYILNDKDPDFRVLNLSLGVFNDASTSYFHKSIGGYHGAKLRRYDDLISKYLHAELNKLFTSLSNIPRCPVLNMLNTKYIIYNPNSEPMENPFAFGNAWTVNDIRWTATPNEEFEALDSTDLRHTAVVNTEFQSQLADFHPDGQGAIALTEYKPNQLTYDFEANSDQLVVFSEIWTRQGWTLTIDNQEQPLLRANYLLRAAKVPAGRHQIVMRYEPKIWKTGNTIQMVSSSLLLLGLIGAIVFSLVRKKKEVE